VNHETQVLVQWGRVLAHPTRVALLRELSSMGEASPRVLADRIHQPLGQVSYHVRTLRSWDMLELRGTTARRGAVEHHYRLARSARPVIRAMLTLSTVGRTRR
jgi:DNA-binding transcriptional ArsR family regulator